MIKSIIPDFETVNNLIYVILERYVSASMLWRDKTTEELAKDTLDCGNFALTVDLNRMGEQMGEDEYIDCKFDGNRMRIEQAKQHDSSSNPFEK